MSDQGVNHAKSPPRRLISDYTMPSIAANIGTREHSVAPKPQIRQLSGKTMDITPVRSRNAQDFKSNTEPRPPLQQRSKVLKRQFVPPLASSKQRHKQRYSRPQKLLMSMACLVFLAGLLVSAQTLWTNHNASIQVANLAKQASKQVAGSQSSGLPSTVRPTSQAISQYVVAPDLPRYLKIPKLNISARVLQVGLTASGAVGTPSNVFDTAWYTGSATPGQPGATLIDGHVSSWTTHGVFYNLKQLVVGDNIQIIRGDGTVINYQVVKAQTYNINNVDMKAALSPVTAGKSGLNLITCTGQVEKGTSQFNQRIVVFAQQI
jgi:LPXTG-site transpeptidase (sortase) family protein